MLIFSRRSHTVFCKHKRSLGALFALNRSFSSMSGENSPSDDVYVLSSINGTCGVICLNKPSRLNAFNSSMIDKLTTSLVTMQQDHSVNCILLKSTLPKAFCAGGDVQAVIESAKNKQSYHRTFFYQEYIMDYLTATCNKPYIALINGITMGGGVGISVHGKYRVATETSLFAMPETAIGLVPDVGGGHFLPQLPGNLGMYLALTGHRLKGYDLLHAGIATHFVNSSSLLDLENDLGKLASDDNAHERVKKVLDDYQQTSVSNIDTPKFSLQDKLKDIEEIFGSNSVEEVISELKKHKSEWSDKTLSLLSKMSPRSLKLTHKQLNVCKHLSLAETLKVEYRLTVGCCELDGDFIEGVRALLVDKDNSPKWNPASIDQVKDSFIDKFFEPLERDLDVVAEIDRLMKN